MVATQLTPTPPFVPYLPMSGPRSLDPADSILLYVAPIPWKGNEHSHGHCPGSRTGQRLDVDMTPVESALFTPPSRTPLTSHLSPGIAAPAQTVSTPGIYGKASCHSPPPTMGGGSSPGEIRRFWTRYTEPTKRNDRSNETQSNNYPLTTILCRLWKGSTQGRCSEDLESGKVSYPHRQLMNYFGPSWVCGTNIWRSACTHLDYPSSGKVCKE
jgi:hypothetical protein